MGNNGKVSSVFEGFNYLHFSHGFFFGSKGELGHLLVGEKKRVGLVKKKDASLEV